MLFNSYVFILIFLPVTVGGYSLLLVRGRHRLSLAWLVAASLIFYGWWNPAYLALIFFSMAANYALGLGIDRTPAQRGLRRMVVVGGVALNLGLLGYFKYANFVVINFNALAGSDFHLETIILPLAISFFTFQQIAYLVDVYKWGRPERDLLNYALFVTFFPQLIAGPIVHHGEMLPQFRDSQARRLDAHLFALGVTVFVFGLCKKVVIADTAALYASPVFAAAQAGAAPAFYEAWRGALTYTIQLYSDFSGYSDMAIGLGLMLGIRLPVNFNSPYQATNIIEFWRRWHMTLSRFLRDYLYIPLGGSRRGTPVRYRNLMITMLLGGLWHGAGWTFVVWGGLHGVYLLINHAWRAWRGQGAGPRREPSRMARAAGMALTFLAVVAAWVVFRAESFPAALRILEGMAGLNGLGKFGRGAPALVLIAALWVLFRAPNPLRFVLGHAGDEHIADPKPAAAWGRLHWRPSARWGYVVALIAFVSLILVNGVGFQESEFLYYQF